MKIIVAGASGQIGSFLVPMLLDIPGIVVTGISRKQPEYAAPLIENGSLKYTEVDLLDKDKLDEVVKGHDLAFITTCPEEYLEKAECNYIDACVKGGVKRIIKIGSFYNTMHEGFGGHGEIHHRINQHLFDTELSSVVVAPPLFMQNLYVILPMAHQKRLRFKGAELLKIPMLHTSDIAQYSLALLLCDERQFQKYDKKIVALPWETQGLFMKLYYDELVARGFGFSGYQDMEDDEFFATLLDVGAPRGVGINMTAFWHDFALAHKKYNDFFAEDNYEKSLLSLSYAPKKHILFSEFMDELVQYNEELINYSLSL